MVSDLWSRAGSGWSALILFRTKSAGESARAFSCNVLNRTNVFLAGQVETMPGTRPESGQDYAKAVRGASRIEN